MKLLSLWEPWATLMALDAKKIETRSWATSYRGWLAIQASKLGLSQRDLREICSTRVFRNALGWEHSMLPMSALCGAFPRGKITAVVRLVDCPLMVQCHCGGSDIECVNCAGSGARLNGGHRLTLQERTFGNYEAGRYGWITSDLFRLPEPIAFKAAQGLCDVPDEIVAQITRQGWCCDPHITDSAAGARTGTLGLF